MTEDAKTEETAEPRIGWTQALCEPCFQAWNLGRGKQPREPTRLKDPAEGDPCLVCGTDTTIFVRIDPALLGSFRHAKLRED